MHPIEIEVLLLFVDTGTKRAYTIMKAVFINHIVARIS